MRRWAAMALVMVPTAAAAQDDGPRFCPNRPSLESSACVTEPGRAHVEVNLADWQLDDNDDSRNDRVLVANVLTRYGVGPSTEVQLSWVAFGHDRDRDKTAGSIDTTRGVGDVTLAVRQNLRNPDGKGLSFGVQPFVTLPTGRRPIGEGDWGAGVIVPVTYDLTKAVNIGATGEVDARPDKDGHGRHFQASGVVAASIDLSEAVSATIEAELLRDEDPQGATTQALGGLGLTWKVTKTRALYAEAVAGLNHDSPDIRLYAGFAVLL